LTGENRKSRRKTCPSATLSTTNATWIDPGANPGLHGERPATNYLSHGTAQYPSYKQLASPLRRFTAPPPPEVERPKLSEHLAYLLSYCSISVTQLIHFALSAFILPMQFVRKIGGLDGEVSDEIRFTSENYVTDVSRPIAR
jgi:hypothetical protein